MTSTLATVSTDIPSHEAIHGVCLYPIITLAISDTFRIRDFKNYPIPTRHDTRKISYGFWSTDCLSEVSRYVYRIEVNGNRDNVMRIPEANRPEKRGDTYQWEIVRIWPRQIAEPKMLDMYTQLRLMIAETIRVHSWGQGARRRVSDEVSQSQMQRIDTRTRRLSIKASMIFGKLPSNWVNWRLQGRLQGRYVHKSRVTGNSETGHSPEAIYEWRATHIYPHSRQQLKSRSPSTRLDGVIYVTEAVKSVNWHIPQTMCTYGGSGRIYAICTIHT